MLLSLKNIKRIEAVKVEVRLFLQKLSENVHKSYKLFLISQHQKRGERLQFIRLEKKRAYKELQTLMAKLEAETAGIHKERNEIFYALFSGGKEDNLC
jgi:hypothetical protein